MSAKWYKTPHVNIIICVDMGGYHNRSSNKNNPYLYYYQIKNIFICSENDRLNKNLGFCIFVLVSFQVEILVFPISNYSLRMNEYINEHTKVPFL